MSGWAAIYGGQMAINSRNVKPTGPSAERPILWTTWESVDKKSRVDFSELDGQLEDLRTGVDTIQYEGQEFKLINTYERSR